MNQFDLSAHAFHRILRAHPEIGERVSRTVAELSASSGQAPAGADNIAAAHMAEALQSRARGLG